MTHTKEDNSSLKVSGESVAGCGGGGGGGRCVCAYIYINLKIKICCL